MTKNYCVECGRGSSSYGKLIFKEFNKFIGFWLYIIFSLIVFFPLWFTVALIGYIYGWGYDKSSWVKECKSILTFKWIANNIINNKSKIGTDDHVSLLLFGAMFNILTINFIFMLIDLKK